MRASRWLAPLAALVVLVGACGDDGDDRSGPARSSQPAPSSTTTQAAPTAPPENAACTLVTRADAEAVFGAPARPAKPLAVAGDAVCAWESGDESESSYQTLQFRLHEGSDIATYSVTAAPVNITVQRAVNGRTFAFGYVAEGGDADAKRTAVNDLADSVIGRAE